MNDRSRLAKWSVLASIVLSGCRGPESTASPPTTSAAPPKASATPAPIASASTAPTASGTTIDAKAWSFDTDKAEAAPAGFSFGRTGSGKEGRWLVQPAPDAPTKPNVLVQTDADATDVRFPIAVVEAPSFKDVKLSVSCKPISGNVDQACGLVWRYKDAKNYYVTRANALEDNVRLYHVKDGNRVQFASWSGKVATKKWHRLAVDAKGDRFVVHFDDQKVLDAKDSTFGDAGKIGVWTKADSITQFDDLQATAE